MSAKDHMSRIIIDVHKEDHKRLKLLPHLSKSIWKIVIGWIHEHLYSINTPNAEALELIKQIECCKNLHENDNIDELFKKLGI